MTGRNAPCPCGSGRKYKQCCLRAEQEQRVANTTDSGVGVALAWLNERFRRQSRESIERDFFKGFVPTQVSKAVARMAPGYAEMLDINIGDFLLLEAYYAQGNEDGRGIDWVLDGGPRLKPDQREFLEALAAAPLRLYEVINAVPGEGLALRDAIDDSRSPPFVSERTASQSLQPGDMLGARIVRLPMRCEIGGAVYPLNDGVAAQVIEHVRNIVEDQELATAIRIAWLRGLIHPSVPQIVDLQTGEATLMVEDDYDVLDPSAFANALDKCADVEGTAREGWTRVERADADATRVVGVIRSTDLPRRITLFHTTLRRANAGREWLESIAGDTVAHRTRRTTDPFEALSADDIVAPRKGRAASVPDLSPEDLGTLFEQGIRHTYANWCDERIPMLEHKTPRQCIGTKQGRQRVRSLLSMYEKGEARQAKDQGRPPVSYDFLWHQLGLARDES